MGKKRVVKKAVAPTEIKAPGELVRVPTGKKKKITRGRVYIKSTYNNTMITFTDERGNVLLWDSAGTIGFSGTKKSTPFAASRIADTLALKMKKLGVADLEIYVKGIGAGRESAVRALINHGFNVHLIKDITPVPHNGPRPKKARRV